MASKTPEAPEGFSEAEEPETEQNEFDTEWTDRPQLGEQIRGVVLARKTNVGQYDSPLIEMRLTDPYGEHDEDTNVCFYSTDGLKKTLDANGVGRGDEIIIYVKELIEVEGDERRKYGVYTQD